MPQQPEHPVHPEHPNTPGMAGKTVQANLEVQSVSFNLSTATERQLLIAIYQQGARMATEIDNLKQAVTDVQTAAAAEATRLEAIIATLRSGTISPADVQAAADQLEVVAANLNSIEAAPAPAAPADAGTGSAPPTP